jgi:hypothetical protein
LRLKAIAHSAYALILPVHFARGLWPDDNGISERGSLKEGLSTKSAAPTGLPFATCAGILSVRLALLSTHTLQVSISLLISFSPRNFRIIHVIRQPDWKKNGPISRATVIRYDNAAQHINNI